MKYFKNIKSFEDLKTQFKALAKKNHPDAGGDMLEMKAINCEYDALFSIWKNRKESDTGEKINETSDSTRRSFYTEWGWEGSRYNVNMTTTEISKTIKIYCKEKYPTWKFSVTSEYFSGGSSINISVMEAPVQIFNLEAENVGGVPGKDIDKKINDGEMYWQLHSISDRDKGCFTEYGLSVIEDVYRFMQSYNYDDSDAMIDYFSCNFYSSIYIGKWNKGFKIVPKTARIKNCPETMNPAAIKLAPSDYSIEEDVHTITGERIWVVKFNKSLSREEYLQEAAKMNDAGSYYSKFKHGFIFKEDPTDKLKTA